MRIAALLLSLLSITQDELDNRIRVLIADLGSEVIGVRERATKDLIALGVEALPRLEKIRSGAEGEVRARLTVAIESLSREVKLLKRAPLFRPVTVSAKDLPLKDFLKAVGSQVGVSCEFDPEVAGLAVNVEAKDEPLLKVLDGICRVRGDLTYEISKGKLRVAAGDHPNVPTAYAGPYRARLMSIENPAAQSFALYIRFDAQPDHLYISVTGSEAPPPPGFSIRSAVKAPITTWESSSLNGLTIQLDDLRIPLQRPEDLGGIFLVKCAKGSAPTLGTLRFAARFQFSLGSSSSETPMTEHPRKLTVGDYFLIFRGPRMIVQRDESVPRSFRPSLEELADLDSFTVTEAGGKKIRLVSQGKKGDFTSGYRYEFVAEEDLKGPVHKVQYNFYDLAARDVEFELKDIKLRD